MDTIYFPGAWFEYLDHDKESETYNTYVKCQSEAVIDGQLVTKNHGSIPTDDIDHIFLSDGLLTQLGFRSIARGERFHRKHLFLKKSNGSYSLVGYDTCMVRTLDRLQLINKLINGDELEPNY